MEIYTGYTYNFGFWGKGKDFVGCSFLVGGFFFFLGLITRIAKRKVRMSVGLTRLGGLESRSLCGSF